MSNSWLRTIFVFSAMATVCGCGCNDDDPPKPPVPEGVAAVNGLFYRGNMGSDDMDRPLVFAVADNKGAYVPDQWVHFSLLTGDGLISADSLKTGSDGKATLAYTFSGSLGHAEIRAIARNLDTTYVYLRANTLIPGDHGQGQYVLLDDVYGDVVDFNGEPVTLEAAGLFVEAGYGATKGAVFILYDTNEDGLIDDHSPLYGVRVLDSGIPQPPDGNTFSVRYEGMTADSIQIGSSYWEDIRPVYGEYDSLKFEDNPTHPALVLFYGSRHLEFWCHPDDTVVFQITVHEEFDASQYIEPPTPEAVVAANGLFYKGEMGGNSIDRPLQFAVATGRGSCLPHQWIHFSLLEGDGAISSDSLETGVSGMATLTYSFSGLSGHAKIRAVAKNVDSVGVVIRANTLIPGDHGQGQYVLLDDTYGDVVTFNGAPVSVDAFPTVGIAVANYEATLGVVVVIYDTDENGVIEDTSPVWAVIVVDSVYPQPPDSTTMCARYEGTTVDGIGIGSHWLNDVVPVYTFPDFVVVDNGDPNLPAHKIVYDSLHLTFWCRQSDSTAFQIDIAEEFDVSLYESPPVREAIDSVMRLVGRDL